MSLLEELKRFRKKDIRNKLIALSNKLRIKIYPDFFHNSGIKKFHTNFIFYLITRENFKKIKKKNYKNIFENRPSKNKTNHLIALPRSASNLVRNLISSYIEVFFNFGNGVPKYDGINNRWYRTNSTVISGDLYNRVSFNDNHFDILKVISKEEF